MYTSLALTVSLLSWLSGLLYSIFVCGFHILSFLHFLHYCFSYPRFPWCYFHLILWQACYILMHLVSLKNFIEFFSFWYFSSFFLSKQFRIKIGITIIFRFHCRPNQLVVYVPVGLSSICWHLLQVLGVDIPSFKGPGRATEGISTSNKTCRRC